jgi:hypothetical protein
MSVYWWLVNELYYPLWHFGDCISVAMIVGEQLRASMNVWARNHEPRIIRVENWAYVWRKLHTVGHMKSIYKQCRDSSRFWYQSTTFRYTGIIEWAESIDVIVWPRNTRLHNNKNAEWMICDLLVLEANTKIPIAEQNKWVNASDANMSGFYERLWV